MPVQIGDLQSQPFRKRLVIGVLSGDVCASGDGEAAIQRTRESQIELIAQMDNTTIRVS